MDSGVEFAVGYIRHYQVLACSPCPLEKSCGGLSELVAS
jgi:hypothetical protein